MITCSSSIIVFSILFSFGLTSDIVERPLKIPNLRKPIISSPYFAHDAMFESLNWKAPMTFRCSNGKYINKNFFCANTVFIHKEETCEDESHSSFGCDRVRCGNGEFKCTSGLCMDADVRCNTKKECPDESDEFNCGDEVKIQNCSLGDGKFLCYDKLRCLDLKYACDGKCNCFDCSDENANCTANDGELIEKCPGKYFATPNGPKCFCDSNDSKMNNLCKEVKPCHSTKSHICSQKCFQYENQIACSCYENYLLKNASSGFTCSYQAFYDNLLAYSTSNQMKIVNLTSGQITVVKKNIQIGVLTGAGINLYYTTYDDDRKTIYKVPISTGDPVEVAKSNASIVSIAIDYVTSNLYYTTNTSLSVCSQDGRCLLLKCCNVRYVALAPRYGLMFYMKKNDFQEDRFIMKSAMDGSNEEYLIDGGFSQFSPLAIDESTRKIYWTQFEEREIWSMSIDDANNNELRGVNYHGTLLYFTILDSALMFTKVRDNEIYTIDNIERYTRNMKNPVAGISYVLSDRNSHPFLSAYPSASYGYTSRISLDVGRDGYGLTPLRPIPLSDENATRLIDNNVTFSIKYLHAFNPTWQNTIKNPCAKASCDDLCILSSSSNFVCKPYNKSNNLTEGQTQSQNHWALVKTSLIVVGLMVFAVAMYVAFRNRYRLPLSNFISRRSLSSDREKLSVSLSNIR